MVVCLNPCTLAVHSCSWQAQHQGYPKMRFRFYITSLLLVYLAPPPPTPFTCAITPSSPCAIATCLTVVQSVSSVLLHVCAVWLGFFITMGLPVSAFTFDLHKELLQCVAAASAGSSFIVTVLVWRLYLGWQHVGDRLISATIEYEETGWYDGQVGVALSREYQRKQGLGC